MEQNSLSGVAKANNITGRSKKLLLYMRSWNGSFSDFYHDGKPLPAGAGVSAVTIEYFQNL